MTPPARPDDAPSRRAMKASQDAQSAHLDPGPEARPPVDGLLRSWRHSFVDGPSDEVASKHLTSIVAAATVLAHAPDELGAPALSWRTRAGQLMAATTAKIGIGAVAATATTTGLAATGSLPKPVGDTITAISQAVNPFNWAQGRDEPAVEILQVPPPSAAIAAPVTEAAPPVGPPEAAANEPLLSLVPQGPAAVGPTDNAEEPASGCEVVHEPAQAEPTDQEATEPEPTDPDATPSDPEPSESDPQNPEPTPTDTEPEGTGTEPDAASGADEDRAPGSNGQRRGQGHDLGDDNQPTSSNEPVAAKPAADPTEPEPTEPEPTESESTQEPADEPTDAGSTPATEPDSASQDPASDEADESGASPSCGGGDTGPDEASGDAQTPTSDSTDPGSDASEPTEPGDDPTTEPTEEPTGEPSEEPSTEPTPEPTPDPTGSGRR